MERESFISLKQISKEIECEKRIQPLVNFINSVSLFCTVSSCEGHPLLRYHNPEYLKYILGHSAYKDYPCFIDINNFRIFGPAYVRFISLDDIFAENFITQISIHPKPNIYDFCVSCGFDYVGKNRPYYNDHGFQDILLKDWKLEIRGIEKWIGKDGDKALEDALEYSLWLFQKILGTISKVKELCTGSK